MSIDKSGYNTGSEAEFYPPSQATGAPYAPLAGQGQYAQVQSVQGTIVNPVQGTYAQPAYAQPSYSVQPAQFAAQGYAHGGQQGQELPMPATRQRPQGQWGDGLCDWPTNLFPSCYCTCCCSHGCWIIAQMAQKVGLADFKTIAITYAVIMLIAVIIQLVTGNVATLWLPWLFTFVVSLILRMKVVSMDNIARDGCSQFNEFCIGVWCCPCSTSQMARHIYGYKQVLDGDGDIFRPDGYAPTAAAGGPVNV